MACAGLSLVRGGSQTRTLRLRVAAIALQREGTEGAALVDTQRDGLHGAGEGKASLPGC